MDHFWFIYAECRYETITICDKGYVILMCFDYNSRGILYFSICLAQVYICTLDDRFRIIDLPQPHVLVSKGKHPMFKGCFINKNSLYYVIIADLSEDHIIVLDYVDHLPFHLV